MRTRSATWPQLVATCSLLCSLIWSHPALAADAVEDLLTRGWYTVEFMVFERSEVMDFNTREVLVHHEPRRYPAKLLALTPQAQDYESYYRIDALTRLCLTYPTLEYSSPLQTDRYAGSPFEPEMMPAEPAQAEEGTLEGATEGTLPGTRADSPATAQPGFPPPGIEPRLEPDPWLDLLAQVAQFERDLQEQSNRWLPAATFALKREARLVERRGVGRILHHGRWLQAVPPRDAPSPVLIQAGTRIDAQWELEGTIAVTLGRYLHFQAELFYTAPGLGLRPAEVLLGGEGPVAVEIPEGPRTSYMVLAESRRMRSEKIHYLDHPKLGIVVRLDPVAIPESLVAAFEAVQALEETTQ